MGARRTTALDRHAERVARFEYIDWRKLSGAHVVVTGSTGLIGSALVRSLVAASRRRGLGLVVHAAARDVDGADRMLSGLGAQVFAWRAGERLDPGCRSDFLVHAASPTSSEGFVERPVETIESIVDGGADALGLARRDGCRAVVLSSMEVYGRARGRVSESSGGDLDPTSVRSSYPEAKRLVECLCAAHASEFGADVSVVRLAQTFGQGVSPGDGRAFACFARQALAGRDVVLATDGSKRNPYLSVDDAVGAILCAMLEGEPGEAYNAANEETYCSVREMAGVAARVLGGRGVRVRVEPDSARAAAFREPCELDMDCAKLEFLGWRAADSLADMFEALSAGWGVA